MDAQLVLAAAPLAALGGLLMVLAAIDLVGRERIEVTGGSKMLWAVGLLLAPVGPIAVVSRQVV
ncbi:MAG: hypothetical protein O2826_04905 [Chloroflexi bacterium]|nr:hypothetical protein [Chloroflexota bacterium]MDA1173844.1 hypothetical protein [Chloroflexota bacterium]